MELDELEPRTAGIARTCPATDRPMSGCRGSTMSPVAGVHPTPEAQRLAEREDRAGGDTGDQRATLDGSARHGLPRTTRPAFAEATQSRIVP